MTYGNTRMVSVTPPIQAAAYGAGDIVGGLVQVGPLGSATARGVLNMLSVVDRAGLGTPLTFLFFKSRPLGTFTENAAPVFNAADWANLYAHAEVTADDYIDVLTASVATVSPMIPAIGDLDKRSIWVLVLAGGTPTFVTTGDLTLNFGILCD